MSRKVEPELIENPRVQALLQVLLACREEQLLVRFLRDLLTVKETRAFANRWAAAQLLIQGKNQKETAQQLKMSTKTVNKIDGWVHGPYATGGFRDAFERLYGQFTGKDPGEGGRS